MILGCLSHVRIRGTRFPDAELPFCLADIIRQNTAQYHGDEGHSLKFLDILTDHGI
jgi:hypothetical protein